MKTIQEYKKLLKDCEWNAEPRKKGKNWGIGGSTLLDASTEQGAWELWYAYCKDNGKIK
jgi:hypothetical protein